METYKYEKIRNVAVLGHGGSGKTTLVEAMAYTTGLITRQGKVEEGNTISDFDREEIKRMFSISTSVVPVIWEDTKINFLDTPGYFDFVGEVEEAISACDAAVIVVSAKKGIEVGTRKAWEICERYNILLPVQTAFINWPQEPDSYLESILGNRCKKLNPLRDFMNHNLIICAGSDGPCTDPDPIQWIYKACNHSVEMLFSGQLPHVLIQSRYILRKKSCHHRYGDKKQQCHNLSVFFDPTPSAPPQRFCRTVWSQPHKNCDLISAIYSW